MWAAKCFALWRKEEEMSRIGKNPIILPAGVEASVDAAEITVKGPLGTLKMAAHPAVEVKVEGAKVVCARVGGVENASAMWGTLRANLNNMVTGVSKGFEKKLTLVGVGYRAQAQGDVVNLTLGFSHPVAHKMPAGVKVETPSQTEIVIKGVDKQKVGQVAAEVRAYRSPEPYKGKGVRYADEVVSLKETKKK
jgi:large subunit ribosomal protein L6